MSKHREKLTEAIAHAKAVREAAIRNAKAALTESLEPSLREDFSRMVSEEETEEEEINEYSDDMVSEMEEVDEDLNLDEILSEMEEEEISEAKEEEKEEEVSEAKKDEEDDNEEEEEEGDDEEETINLEDLTEPELKKIILSVIEDLESEGDEAEIEDEMGEEEEEEVEGAEMMDEIDLNELLNELINEEDDEEEPVNENATTDAKYQKDGYAKFSKSAGDKGMYKKDTVGKEYYKTGLKEENTKLKSLLKKKDALLKEALETNDYLTNELSDLNLLNAKLLYTNKIFNAKNLNESQKVRVLETFDKASNVNEVELVYETLKDGLVSRNTKIIKEHVQSASSMATPPTKRPIVEVNSAFERMQKLAFHKSQH